MLYWSVVFLVVALIAGVLGFTGIAVAAAGIAKVLFVIFLILFLISLVCEGRLLLRKMRAVLGPMRPAVEAVHPPVRPRYSQDVAAFRAVISPTQRASIYANQAETNCLGMVDECGHASSTSPRQGPDSGRLYRGSRNCRPDHRISFGAKRKIGRRGG